MTDRKLGTVLRKGRELSSRLPNEVYTPVIFISFQTGRQERAEGKCLVPGHQQLVERVGMPGP